MREGGEHPKQAQSGEVRNGILSSMPARIGYLVLIVGFGLVLGFGVRLYDAQRIEAQSQKEAPCHPGSYPNCSTGPVPISEMEHIEAQSEKEQSQRSEYRSEKDLKAQEIMAFWTRLVGIFTGAGIILLGWTLSATRETLRQAELATDAAREATNETKRIGEAQVRAYLYVKEVEIRHANQGGFEVWAKIDNSGQSPATFFEVSSFAINCPCDEICSDKIPTRNDSDETDTWSSLGAKQDTEAELCGGSVSQHTISSYLVGSTENLMIVGWVRYGDIIGREYISEFAFMGQMESYFEEWIKGKDPIHLTRPPCNLRVFMPIEDAAKEDSKKYGKYKEN